MASNLIPGVIAAGGPGSSWITGSGDPGPGGNFFSGIEDLAALASGGPAIVYMGGDTSKRTGRPMNGPPSCARRDVAKIMRETASAARRMKPPQLDSTATFGQRVSGPLRGTRLGHYLIGAGAI